MDIFYEKCTCVFFSETNLRKCSAWKNKSHAMNNLNEKLDLSLSKMGSKVDLQENDVQEMEKTVGLVGGISLIVGTMIGSGIFASASAVAENSVSVGVTLIVWVGCGIVAMMASLCYIELGVSIPKSGGEYSYLLEAYGEIPLFYWILYQPWGTVFLDYNVN